MITVSRLVGFEPGPWQTCADWSRDKGKSAQRTETDLNQEAAKVARAWPSSVGQLAAAVLRQQADAQGELAVAYDDAAVVIDDATIAMTGLQTQMTDLQATVAGTPDMSGPDDSGVVTCTLSFSFPDIINYLQGRAQAGQLTITAREILMQATDRDRTASIALLAIVCIRCAAHQRRADRPLRRRHPAAGRPQLPGPLRRLHHAVHADRHRERLLLHPAAHGLGPLDGHLPGDALPRR